MCSSTSVAWAARVAGAFVPHLKDFVRASKESAPAGSRFELVFLACDADAASAREYWSKADLPGGMIRFESRLAAAELDGAPAFETLPGLFVFDRKGELLDRNHPKRGQPERRRRARALRGAHCRCALTSATGVLPSFWISSRAATVRECSAPYKALSCRSAVMA